MPGHTALVTNLPGRFIIYSDYAKGARPLERAEIVAVRIVAEELKLTLRWLSDGELTDNVALSWVVVL